MSDSDGPSFFERINNAVRGIANGITFGFADKFQAGAETLAGQGSYDENIKEQHAMDDNGGAEYKAGVVTGALLPASKVLRVGLGSIHALEAGMKAADAGGDAVSPEVSRGDAIINKIGLAKFSANAGAVVGVAASVTAATSVGVNLLPSGSNSDKSKGQGR